MPTKSPRPYRLDVDLDAWRLARSESVETARQALREGEGGISIADALTARLDEGLRRLADTVAALTTPPACFMYATGGYARGWLAPGSDVDLLLVYEPGSSDALAGFSGALQTALRDIGYRVGLAARTPQECADMAAADLTIAASMLDARVVWSTDAKPTTSWHKPADLGDFVARRLRAVRRGRGFAEAVRKGCAERHARHGRTIYRLEPNIKYGRGGLRDIQALLWSARVLHGALELDDIRRVVGISPGDVEAFRTAADLLFRVRIALHLQGGKRANDRLTFERQEQLAPQFVPASDAAGPLPVERFMQQVYQATSRVTTDALGWQDIWLLGEDHAAPVRLYEGICLRQEHVDLARAGDRHGGTIVPHPVEPALHPAPPQTEETVLVGPQTSDLADPAVDILGDNPLRLLEMAMALSRPVHPVAKAQFARTARAMKTEDLVGDVHRSAHRLLTSLSCPFELLELLGDTGALATVIPEFEPVRALAIHDIYHVYTVDAHLLRTLEELKALIRGEALGDDIAPWMLELGRSVPSHRHDVLLLSGLTHDIGKGRGGDHSEIGAELAVPIARRLGLSEVQGRHLSTLVLHHLLMPKVSQRRDLNDEQTILHVATIVRSVPTLEDLTLLTLADIRAVRADNLSAWKANLLLELYSKVRDVLETGTAEVWQRRAAKTERLAEVRALLSDDVITDGLETFFAEASSTYVLGTPAETIARHFEAYAAPSHTVVEYVSGSPGQPDEVVVASKDAPHMLASIARVLSAHGVNILGAEILTSASERTLDVFTIDGGDAALSARRRQRVIDDLHAVLSGQVESRDLLRQARQGGLPARHMPSVRTVIRVDREASERFTVVEVRAQDRLGLLARIAATISASGANIGLSRVVTEGASVVDAFYVASPEGGPLDDHALETLVAELYDAIAALEEEADAAR